MGFRKFAALDVLDAWRVPAGTSARALRKAAHRVEFDYTPRHGYLYVRSRMISSRCNDNHDEFPAGEIEKAYRTFLGKPVFVNHHNANHRRARGVIVAVALHRDRNPDGTPDTWVEGLMEVDALRFPKLAKAILSRRIDKTSMGVDVAFSVCSACGNKAESPADYCSHLPALKGKKIRQRGSDGRLREEIIREKCHGLSFFENSLLVEDPADPTAQVWGVDGRGMAKAAARQVTAALTVPHPGRLQGGTCRENCTYGGTRCLMCHEPVLINLHKTDTASGGWHHHDGMKRDHPALPADADSVIASIPAQLARKDQVREQVADTLERQGLPRRQPRGMPPDPFLAARRYFEQPLYHGTRSPLERGDMLTVDQAARHPNNPDIRNQPYVHATTDPAEAHRWGDRASSYAADAHAQESGRQRQVQPGYSQDHAYPPRVYRVRPTGPVEPDLEYADTEKNSFRSARPFRVAEEVHPRSCYAGECNNAEHWPDHPHYEFLGDDDDDEGSYGHYGSLSLMAHFKQAITGEEAEPGHSIWARPAEEPSPAAAELWHNMTTREPHSWYRGMTYHGPYHLIRHPETRSTHVVDAQGRDAAPSAAGRGGGFGNHETNGSYGEQQAENLWRGLESAGPDKHRIGTEDKPSFELTRERTPAFEHSRIDPQDIERARRPDARVHAPEGYSPDDEWHGPYEVVRHPETSRFHVVDNAGRNAPGSWRGHETQMRAEHSRDYIDRRQQSKDRGRQIANQIFDKGMEILDPGGTQESRQSDRNMERGQDLMRRYEGAPGKMKFDSDEDGGAPYYEHEHKLPSGHPSGWTARHYGPGFFTIHHRATGDEEHEQIHIPYRENSYEAHPGYGHKQLAQDLSEWHDEDHGTREYLDQDPRMVRWRRRNRLAMRRSAQDTSYRMSHEGPDDDQGEALHELGTTGSTYPDDVLHNLRDYRAEHGETMDKIHRFTGRPYGRVTVYRALPSPHRSINPGDWVATAAAYARSEGRMTNPADDFPVIKATVRADQIRNDGNSLEEWSYHGPPIKRAKLHFGGGDNHRGKSGRGRTDSTPEEHEPMEMRQHYGDMVVRAREQRKEHRAKEDAWHRGEGPPPGQFRFQAARYDSPGDHPFFQQNPVSSQNVADAYRDSTDDEKNLGHRWYSDAHDVATAIAGGDAARGAGLVAAYSPRTSWPVNLHNASRAHTQDRAFGGPGTGAMGMHGRLAQRIIDGQHHSEAFAESAPKIGAFAHLIEHGGDAPGDAENGTQRVVVDRHALSTAIGRRVSDADLQVVPIDKERYYNHVGDAYRQAAADLTHELGQTVAPHQIQATVWLRQQRLNQAQDRSGSARGGGGRVRREQNAWDAWNEHARQNHPEIPGGSMHMQGSRRTAIGETTVPPQINTLRQEECPVCGESEVWTGQRCPVCGFVAPPDLFRDPDLTKAREMRDQMATDPAAGQFPQGPADEEAMAQGSFPDADGQLFHPDQITPNGVPAGGGPPVQQDGTGLPPGPDDEEQGLEPGEEEPGDELAAEQEEQEEQESGGTLGCPECGTEFGPGQDGAQEGQPCPACGQGTLVPVDAGDDAEKDQEPQGGKVMAGSTTERAAFEAQRRVIAAQRGQIAALQQQLSFLASLAGVGPEMEAIRVQAMRRTADEMNPGQPVPDPPEAPAPETTEQALAPAAMGDAQRPGTEPGSVTHVPAAATTTAITPGVEIQTPPATNLVDVTAPVQGTNPSQDGGVPLEQRRIETDVRVDPDPLKAAGPGIGGAGNNGTAFPWTMAARQNGAPPARSDGEAMAAQRVMGAVRLARLRITAGLARGDELDVAGQIERDASLTPALMEHEIALLSSMPGRQAPRRPMPRTAGARSAPSMAAPLQPVTAGAYAPGDGVEDADLFLS